MLNSVGLQGPGLAAWLAHDLPALHAAGRPRRREHLGSYRVGLRQGGGAGGRRRLPRARAPASTALEVNVSCPNVEDRSRMFAHSADATARVLEATACGLPRWAKLSPNVPDLVEIATGAVEGGADGLTLVNTLLGLALDTESGRPFLGRRGRALRWRRAPGGRPGRVGVPVGAYPSCPSWAWAASSAATPLSCCSPVPTPSRWAPPRSGIPGRPGRCLRQLAQWCDAHRTSVADIRRGLACGRAGGGGAGGATDERRPRRRTTTTVRPDAAVPSLNEGGRHG